MKALKSFMVFLCVLIYFGCKKETLNQQIIAIPNGDFEYWNDLPTLLDWQTNSCPVCVPPYDAYVVKKVSDAYHGQFAARFIYNSVYNSFADNKFPISIHPSMLTGYVRSTIASGDTAIIHIDLFSGNSIVDSGNWYETSSIARYQKVEIPISQTSSAVDSTSIKITGGRKQNTELYVDNLVFIKIN